ncbi:MAG: phytanoyl-CoA dioxygenase family protein, partial [Gammaproteobacteria bacterium]|nr:phytanoyl-CoA dioxygenase family protein [Gammaproteobacteria bacterium]
HHLLQSPGKLAGLRIRAPKPNAGQQSLHTDWDRAVSIGDYYSVTFILPLVDFLSHNGASRIVPGSHRSEKLPSKAMANSNHAHEQFITCPAGSLIIINSHAWHSATQNRSNERRYSLLAIYHRDQSDQLKF